MMLNKNQKILILAALGIILLMGIFPPWICGISTTIPPGLTSFQETASGYFFFYAPPSPPNVDWGNGHFESYVFRLDYGRLFLQWLLVIFIAWGLFFLFREPRQHQVQQL